MDRLSVSFPVQSWAADESIWDSVTVRGGGRAPGDESWSRSLRVASRSGAPVFLGVAEVAEGRVWGKIEGNPSRLVDPLGCSLVALGGVSGPLEELWSMAGGVMVPGCELGEARLRRVDLARDFRLRVVPPGLFIEGLAKHPRPYAKRSGVWNSPQCGGAQTLHAGSGAGMVRLYDQHAAYPEKLGVVEGALRWEVEARRGWLERAGLGEVDQLVWVPRKVEELVTDRWRWSGMGADVAAGDVVADRALELVAAGRFSPAEARACVGEMFLRAAGRRSITAKHTAAKYARFVGEMGVVLGESAASEGFTARLDWERGCEVLNVAA